MGGYQRYQGLELGGPGDGLQGPVAGLAGGRVAGAGVQEDRHQHRARVLQVAGVRALRRRVQAAVDADGGGAVVLAARLEVRPDLEGEVMPFLG